MKNKDSRHSSKKTKPFILNSTLIRFKQLKRKKSRNKLLMQNLGKHFQVIETFNTWETPKIKTTKPKRNKIVSGSKFVETVSHNGSKLAKKDKPSIASIVQMPSKCKDRPNVNTEFDLSILYDSGKEDLDKFSSVDCLMSSSSKIGAFSTNTYAQENSKSREIHQAVNLGAKQLGLDKTKYSRQECLADDIDLGIAERKCSITACMSDGKISTAKVYELNCSNFIVVLKPEHLFYVIGIVELELVRGSVEVLGYVFNKHRKKVAIFSPVGYSHLFIKATEQGNDFEQYDTFKLEDLCLLGLSNQSYREILREGKNCSIFILSRNTTHVSSSVWPYFFQNYLPFPIFPPSDLVGSEQENRSCHLVESKIGCILEGNVQEEGKEFVELPEWFKVVQEITLNDFPKTILCGGKSVGKSTFLRYLINKLLKKYNKVLILDFDPGQCEFTIPGCISATIMEEPVVGPNFSHLKEPLRSVFLGEIDVTKCPEDYIQGCKDLISYAEKEHASVPWLINTMGFSRGFGVTLTCGIIQSVEPTNVIQIESKNMKFNFPSLLKPEFVYSQNVGSFGVPEDFRTYNFHTLPSAAEYQTTTSQKTRGMSPKEARNLVILSYLSNMLNSEKTNLSQVTPYMIKMEDINLKTTNKSNLSKAQIAAAMNGNMVALCCQAEDDSFLNCHGFGIIRGIDVQFGVLFLITPMPCSTLSRINCLIKGNVNLPESLYFNQGHQVEGHIPYMAHTSGSSTALYAKRDFRILPSTSRGAIKRQYM